MNTAKNLNYTRCSGSFINTFIRKVTNVMQFRITQCHFVAKSIHNNNKIQNTEKNTQFIFSDVLHILPYSIRSSHGID